MSQPARQTSSGPTTLGPKAYEVVDLLTLSLPAHDARARKSFMLLAGAVVVASALTQALAHPMVTAEPTFVSSAAIAAPTPTQRPLAEAATKAADAAAAVPAFAFRAPTPGYEVNSPFGLRRLPWEPRGRMHEGVDIAAPKGLPVGVTLSGVVLRAGLSSTYGRFVEVQHDEGITSLYAHLGSIGRGIAPGVRLTTGQAVGLVGNTGRSTGEHLHFEIRADGKPLNPTLFMGKSFASADDLPLDAAARFSRRVRLAVVSDATLAKMMPTVARAGVGEVAIATQKNGRVHGVLPVSTEPQPNSIAAATARARAVLEASAAPTAASAGGAGVDASAVVPAAD